MKTVIIIAIIAILGILVYFLVPCNKWDKTFAKNPTVISQKVHFTNRYGVALTGDLYMPKNKPADKMAARGYDPNENNGVAFEDLPEDWVCPRCRQPKTKFNAA